MLTLSTGESQRPLKLRHDRDRRIHEDRRRSSVDMRLRVGLWYQYHRATRAGEFDAFPRDRYRRTKVEEALLPEMLKYEFRLRDKSESFVPQPFALARALDFLWAHQELGCNPAGESTAVYAITAISEYLVRTFSTTMLDRRRTERRAAKASAS